MTTHVRIDYDRVQEIVDWCTTHKNNPTVMQYVRMLVKQMNRVEFAEAHLQSIIDRFDLIQSRIEER